MGLAVDIPWTHDLGLVVPLMFHVATHWILLRCMSSVFHVPHQTAPWPCTFCQPGLPVVAMVHGFSCGGCAVSWTDLTDVCKDSSLKDMHRLDSLCSKLDINPCPYRTWIRLLLEPSQCQRLTHDMVLSENHKLGRNLADSSSPKPFHLECTQTVSSPWRCFQGQTVPSLASDPVALNICWPHLHLNAAVSSPTFPSSYPSSTTLVPQPSLSPGSLAPAPSRWPQLQL